MGRKKNASTASRSHRRLKRWLFCIGALLLAPVLFVAAYVLSRDAWHMLDEEKLTYEKLFYHVPKRKIDKPNGGGTPVSHSRSGLGATSNSKSEPLGFPFTIGSWCKKLKDGSYPRLPNPARTMVYQRPQTEGFPKAPLHKERRKILCSTSVLRLMNLSA